MTLGPHTANRRSFLKGFAASSVVLGSKDAVAAKSLGRGQFALEVPDIAWFFQNSSDFQINPGQEILAKAEQAIWQMVDADAAIYDIQRGTQRFIVVPQGGALSLAAFGVDGSASGTDFAAWQAATRAALRHGIRLKGEAGKTYLFDPFKNTSLVVVPMTGQTFWLDMKGATLKFADAMRPEAKTGFFRHQILIAVRRHFGAINQTPELVRLENIVTDGNLRKQIDPRIGTTVAEQMAHIKVMAFANEGNHLRRLEIRNFRSIDPVADCILIGPSQPHAFADGRAGIGQAELENLHAGARQSVRSFVVIGSGVNKVNIRKVTCDPMLGKEGNSIETEFSSIGQQRVNLTIADCDIDDIEMGGRKGRENQLKVTILNSVARRFALFVYCDVEARDCNFGISIPNAWRVGQGLLERVEFKHRVFEDDGGIVQVRPLTLFANTENQNLVVMRDCKHVLFGQPAPKATNPFIGLRATKESQVESKTLILENSWFDDAVPVAVLNHGGWMIESSSCRFAGHDVGVHIAVLPTVSKTSWTSNDDDFTAVRSLPFALSGAKSNQRVVRLIRGKWPTLNFRLKNAKCHNAIQAKNRKLIVEVFPLQAGGVLGDEIWLSQKSAGKHTKGNPVGWACVACGPGGNAKSVAKYQIIATA